MKPEALLPCSQELTTEPFRGPVKIQSTQLSRDLFVYIYQIYLGQWTWFMMTYWYDAQYPNITFFQDPF